MQFAIKCISLDALTREIGTKVNRLVACFLDDHGGRR